MEHTPPGVIQANAVSGLNQEQAIVSAAKAGDRAAFKLLYDNHVGRVYALCYRLTGDKGLAEDVTQEVFIQLWRKLHNFHGQSRFSTWLHSVTANVAVDYMRKQRGWVQRMFNIESTSVMSMPAEAATSEVDLEGLIVRLPERARMVFVLHAIEGYRHDEIANMLAIAVGSSKAQLHRAKQLLKQWMGCDDETL